MLQYSPYKLFNPLLLVIVGVLTFSFGPCFAYVHTQSCTTHAKVLVSKNEDRQLNHHYP